MVDYGDITNEKIKALLQMQKTVDNPQARVKEVEGHEQVTYNVSAEGEEKFLLYKRQNKAEGMADDFSCGLAWITPSGEKLTLIRYNGSSHNHKNKLSGELLGYSCHIHKANTDYLEHTGKADGEATVTDRYSTLNGALHCLLEDCNIDGLTVEQDNPTLFD